jgi:hypothetical protein
MAPFASRSAAASGISGGVDPDVGSGNEAYAASCGDEGSDDVVRRLGGLLLVLTLGAAGCTGTGFDATSDPFTDQSQGQDRRDSARSALR